MVKETWLGCGLGYFIVVFIVLLGVYLYFWLLMVIISLLMFVLSCGVC